MAENCDSRNYRVSNYWKLEKEYLQTGMTTDTLLFCFAYGFKCLFLMGYVGKYTGFYV